MSSKKNILFLLVALLFVGACKTLPQNSKKQSEINNKQSKEFEEIFYAATKARILENFESSQKLYLECIKINPNSDAALYELAKLTILNKHFIILEGL